MSDHGQDHTHSDLLIANNFLECGLLFLQYHKWPSEVARITKANSWMPSKKLLTSQKFVFSCDNQATTFLILGHSVCSYDLLTQGVWLECCLQQSGLYIPFEVVTWLHELYVPALVYLHNHINHYINILSTNHVQF